MPVRQKQPIRILVVEGELLTAFFTSYLGRVWRRANNKQRGFSYQVSTFPDPESAYNWMSSRRIDIVIGRWSYADSNCPSFTMYKHAIESAGDDPALWPHVYILDVLSNEMTDEINRLFAPYITRGLLVHWFHKEDPSTPPKLSREVAVSLSRALELHAQVVT